MFLICYIFFYYTTIVIYFIYLSTDKITNLQPICNFTNNNLTFILLINASYTIHKFEYSNLTIQLFVRQNCLIKNSSKSNQYWNTFNISTRSAIPRVKRQFVIDRRRRPPFEFHPKIAKLRESNTENENSSARIVGGFFCNYVREESSTSDGRAEKSLYSARSPFSQCSLSLRQLEFLDEGN